MELTQRAIAAARALAHRHGLTATTTTLLHDGWNVVVGLAPEPVVIRVATLTAQARHDRIEALLHQEVALIAQLAATGAPTVQPPTGLPAGPHREDGLWLVAMQRADHDPQRTMAGPCQPLHGDAHPGNVLRTPAGPRWTDFEEAAYGPVGWDLACLASRLGEDAPHELEAALDTYGRDQVQDLDAWRGLRALVVVAWSLALAAERGTDPQVPLERWRARLRQAR